MASLLQILQHKLQDPFIPWQKVVLGTVAGVGVVEGWISSRQRPFLNPLLHPHIPAALRPYLKAEDADETHKKSQAYARSKLNYSAVINALDLIETVIVLTGVAAPVFEAVTGLSAGGKNWTLLRGLWDLAAKLPMVGDGASEIRRSMAFIVLTSALGTVLSIPKDLYKNFRMEEKHGFNKMTIGTFCKDAVKGLALSLALEVPIVGGLVKIIHWAGQDAILRVVAWTIAFIFCIQLIMVPLYPAVIQPMFNTFTLLPEDSPVYPRVKALAEKLNFPLGKVWVINGSLRSSHSNAYFYGLPGFSKNIVIYDTLLEKSKPEEVEAILAHELGHWKGNHIPILLVTALAQIALSLTVYTIFLTNRPFLSAFGFSQPSLVSKVLHRASPNRTGPTIIALALASILCAPLVTILSFVVNNITRTLEYDADAFAVKLGPEYAKNLKGALVTIHEKNLSIYGVDPIYSARHHSHPTLVERLEALDAKLEAKKAK
ncbi:hypothetical protein JCM6882_008846 [Rhodosporidiobolus microsporus]